MTPLYMVLCTACASLLKEGYDLSEEGKTDHARCQFCGRLVYGSAYRIKEKK